MATWPVIDAGSGQVRHLRQRDCRLQRQPQKLTALVPASSTNTSPRWCAAAAALGAGLRLMSVVAPRTGWKRPFVDTW